MEFIGLKEINSTFIVLENSDAFYDEMVEIKVNDQKKIGKVVQLEEDKTIIQVFGNNDNISLNNTRTKFTGHPMEIKLSEEINIVPLVPKEIVTSLFAIDPVPIALAALSPAPIITFKSVGKFNSFANFLLMTPMTS